MNIYSQHPEKPDCTRAYMLMARGEPEKAKKLLEAIGYQDARAQIELIEGFIQFQAECNRQIKPQARGRRRCRKQ